MPDGPVYAFYGDDFTGSTDALEVLSKAGIKSLLFLDIPDERGQALLSDCTAFGIAGTCRSLRREEISKETGRIFEWLSHYPLECMHYKICSTLDSSPEHGNIGIAIEQGQRHFGNTLVPFLIGYPVLKRWVAFSQLFAQDGDRISRLDRHSTMAKHPVTPMEEADIRLHLAEQTKVPISAMNLVDLGGSLADRLSVLNPLLESGDSRILVFDTVTMQDLHSCGELMRHSLEKSGPFVVGSSAVEAAWISTRKGLGQVSEPANRLKQAEPFLVISGSASPKTASQIAHCRKLGWTILPLEPWNWFGGEDEESVLEPIVRETVNLLQNGRDVVLISCEGPDDPSIRRTRDAAKAAGCSDPMLRIGSMQGRLLRRVLDEIPLSRICVAGGDTSGYVSRELDIYGLEYLLSIDPGGPVCRARTDRYDHLEICLKGGQVGTSRYFESVREGRKVD